MLSATAIFFASEPAQASDPLFERMQGEWEGRGARRRIASNSKVEIKASTSSVIQGDRLVSRNFLTEVDGKNSKSYSRVYWIRPSSGDAGLYEFGTGEGAEEKVTSQGSFVGGVLAVDQELGGAPPYQVRSLTAFQDGASTYFETTWQGGRKLSETRIEYRRLTGGN